MGTKHKRQKLDFLDALAVASLSSEEISRAKRRRRWREGGGPQDHSNDYPNTTNGGKSKSMRMPSEIRHGYSQLVSALDLSQGLAGYHRAIPDGGRHGKDTTLRFEHHVVIQTSELVQHRQDTEDTITFVEKGTQCELADEECHANLVQVGQTPLDGEWFTQGNKLSHEVDVEMSLDDDVPGAPSSPMQEIQCGLKSMSIHGDGSSPPSKIKHDGIFPAAHPSSKTDTQKSHRCYRSHKRLVNRTYSILSPTPMHTFKDTSRRNRVTDWISMTSEEAMRDANTPPSIAGCEDDNYMGHWGWRSTYAVGPSDSISSVGYAPPARRMRYQPRTRHVDTIMTTSH